MNFRTRAASEVALKRHQKIYLNIEICTPEVGLEALTALSSEILLSYLKHRAEQLGNESRYYP